MLWRVEGPLAEVEFLELGDLPAQVEFNTLQKPKPKHTKKEQHFILRCSLQLTFYEMKHLNQQIANQLVRNELVFNDV